MATGLRIARRIVEGAAHLFARVQRRLHRASPLYYRISQHVGRLAAYALTGDAGFRAGSPAAGPALEPTGAAGPGAAAASPDVARIQVFRRNALGDVLLATPVLRSLREKHPKSKIAVTTYYPEILQGNPYVDEIIRNEAPAPEFDQTFDLRYELTPDEHIVAAYARLAKVEVADATPEIFLEEKDLLAANRILREAGVDLERPICGFQLASGWRVRDWPLAYFRQVAASLAARGVQVIILGTGRDNPAADFGIDLRDRTGIREVAAVASKCTALLTIDSALMHLGVAFRRPVISLFGCTDPEKRLPQWALKNAIYSDIICRGCHHRQRPVPVTTAPECPYETVRCMEGLSPTSVFERLWAALEAEQQPEVSIVIPHYNDFAVLHRCLESIFRTGCGASFEVIVVDDASTDDSVERLSAWAPRVRVVRNPANKGFAATCNAGARAARGKHVCLLNNDTTVTPGWLDELLQPLRDDPKIGATGPKLLYPGSGLIQHCGTAINENGVAEHLYRFLPGTLRAANRERAYRALTGACLLVRKQEFQALGALDEQFQNGGEDTDLCFKYLESGKTLLYRPSSVVFHHEGHTRGLRGLDDRHDRLNRRLLAERWAKYLTPDISDYCLLAEIEAGEGRSWRSLGEVPDAVRARYDRPEARSVGRYPFKVELGSGMNPEPGRLHFEIIPDAPSVDVVHDITQPLPLRDGTVSDLIANHVVEHVSWRVLPHLVRDLSRVMMPGGTVYIRTPNLRYIAEHYLSRDLSKEHPDDEKAMIDGYGAITPGLWSNIKLFSGQDYPSNFHFNCMDPGDLCALFRRCGFGSAEIRHFGREFSPGEIQLVAVK